MRLWFNATVEHAHITLDLFGSIDTSYQVSTLNLGNTIFRQLNFSKDFLTTLLSLRQQTEFVWNISKNTRTLHGDFPSTVQPFENNTITFHFISSHIWILSEIKMFPIMKTILQMLEASKHFFLHSKWTRISMELIILFHLNSKWKYKKKCFRMKGRNALANISFITFLHTKPVRGRSQFT